MDSDSDMVGRDPAGRARCAAGGAEGTGPPSSGSASGQNARLASGGQSLEPGGLASPSQPGAAMDACGARARQVTVTTTAWCAQTGGAR